MGKRTRSPHAWPTPFARQKYHFPLAVFYLPEPSADFAPLRDFRRLPDFRDRTISSNLAFHIRAAHERRELALELYQDLHSTPKAFPLKTTLQDDPEAVGRAIRDFLNVDDESQKKAARQDRSFDFWRRKMEEHDLLVFVVGGPHYGVDLTEVRGFAIAKPRLPVIVINGTDHSQGGKAFTLLHELTHIILGESAISNGATEELGVTQEEQRIERFRPTPMERRRITRDRTVDRCQSPCAPDPFRYPQAGDMGLLQNVASSVRGGKS